jgi:hypothetical protein
VRLRVHRLMVLATLMTACAEPTGTESGNPSQPGAHAPQPLLPPVAPPVPITPIQPGPVVGPNEIPVSQPNVTSEATSAPTSSFEPSTIEEGTSRPPWPGPIGPSAGTAGPTTVDGHGETPPATPEAPGGYMDSGPNSVDAGDAGGVDAGP